MPALAVEAALVDLIATAEAVALPFVSGFQGDRPSVVGIQTGAAGAEIGLFGYMGYWLQQKTRVRLTGPDTCEGIPDCAYKELLILGATLFTVQSLELINGYGRPNVGGEFGEGSTRLGSDISGLLQSAVAIDWSGAGAAEYNRKNQEQQARVAKVAAADHRIAGILKKQSDEVELGREVLAGAQLGLAAGIPVAGSLYAKYVYWRLRSRVDPPLWSIAFSIARVLHEFVETLALAAIAAAAAVIGVLVDVGIRHEKRINDAISDGYGWIDDAVIEKLLSGAAAGADAVGNSRSGSVLLDAFTSDAAGARQG